MNDEPSEYTEGLVGAQVDSWYVVPHELSETTPSSEISAEDLATEQASLLTLRAVLQAEFTHTRQALDSANQRANSLEAQITELKARNTESPSALYILERERDAARAEAEALTAQLAGYVVFGGEKPTGMFSLITLPLLIGVLMVIAAIIGLALLI